MKGIIKLRVFLLTIYLALGPIVWFPYLNITLFKTILLVTLCLSSLNYFTIYRIKGLFFFLLISLFLGICLYINNFNDDYSILVKGVIENYVIFNIGYNIAKDNLLTNKNLITIVCVIGFFSFLTISNYFFGYPNWTSPIEINRVEELSDYLGHDIDASQLWSTGFSISRTGWCNTLVLYLPVCYYLIHIGYNKKICMLIAITIFISIFISGSRGGFVIALLCLVFLLWLKHSISVKGFFIFMIICILLFYFQSSLIEHFRLDREDISTGRLYQYALVPILFSNLKFFGIGYLGTRQFFYENLDQNWSLHNTYLKIFFEYGVIVGIMIVVLTLFIYFRCIKLFIETKINKNNPNPIIFAACLLFFSTFECFFEPGAIYGALSWYSLWWAALGYFIYYCNNKNIEK